MKATRQPPPRPTRHRGTTTSRGYGAAWQRLRLQAFKVWGRTCWRCGLPGADTVDHLDPISTHGAALPHITRVRPAHQSCNSARGNKPADKARSPRSERW